jgi:hypothetical protein
MRPTVVSCQGSAQLVTALASAATSGNRDLSEPGFLVIHDLASPRGEEETFTRAIRHAAEVVGSWRKILAIPNGEQKQWSSGSLRSELDYADPATLFLNSFPTAGGRLIRAAFPDARRVVYGDGIGVNFSALYFAPDPATRLLSHTGRVVRAAIAGRPLEALGVPFADKRIDELHLLLPGLFDEPAPPHVRIQRDTMLALFRRLAFAPSLGIAAVAERLQAAISESDHTLLLLTSNFSETGRMTLAAELRGYLSMVRQEHPTSKTCVVIKPHPRDSKRKLAAVTEAVAKECRVLSLTESPASHLPFEAITSAIVEEQPAIRSKLTGLCVSTACLALEYLYGIPCRVGFGEPEALGFTRPWRRQRARHERDLRQAVVRIRAGEFGNVPQ